MTTVEVYTAAGMDAIKNTTVVDGDVVGDNLILLQRDGTQINAGSVRGPAGPVGPPGDVSQVQLDTAIADLQATVQAAGAVTNAMIALGAITTDRIADAQVTTAKLANLAVTGAKIADATITSGKLANAAVTTDKIANSGITTDKIATNAVTSDKIAASTITYYDQGFIFIQATAPAGVPYGIWIDI